MPMNEDETREVMEAGEQEEDCPEPEGPPWEGAAVREDAIRGNAFIGNSLGGDPAQNIPQYPPAQYDPNPDPWRHRAAGMKCCTCMWFAPKVLAVGETNIGRCRRRAPTMNGYPAVFLTDWCGDHKLDEAKV